MRNLLLFGCDFFPCKKTSELNFWNDMVELFRKRFEEVVILSVNNRDVRRENLFENVYLYNVRPHYPGNRQDSKDPEYSGRRFQRLPFSAIYKSYSLWRYVPLFDRLVRDHSIGVIHYMRVFGLFNRLLLRRYPQVMFSVTVPTHVDRGFPFHRIYHWVKNRALAPMDAIVSTSQATRDRLHGLGLDDKKLKVIPWSVREETGPASRAMQERVRARCQIPAQSDVVLWSGPLQDTGSAEFVCALDIARRVVARSDRHSFVFAFKPDSLARIAGSDAVESPGIKMLETDRALFSDLKTIATVFLSPVCNRNRTVAPPLTWIEMMSRGIPIVTTSVPGVGELIDHGLNGFVAEHADEIVDHLLQLDPAQLELLGREARRVVTDAYCIHDIAEEYATMWEMGRRRGDV